jgi:drug/metabolite transporter (DMT)-like permease
MEGLDKEGLDNRLLPHGYPNESEPTGELEWSKNRYMYGILLVILQVTTNVASGELMQQQESSAGQFNSPYFSVWFNHFFTGAACGIIAVGIIWSENIRRTQAGKATRTILQALKEEVGLYSWSHGTRVGLWLAVLYKYNVFWAAAINVTSVSIFYALTQSSCVVVFLLSIKLLGEEVTVGKIGSLVLCVAGVLVVSLQMSHTNTDSTSTTTTAFGLAMTLICTVLQSVYYVGYKRQMQICGKFAKGGSASQLGALLVLALMGLGNLLFLW